jgi:deoxycytidylate deaminase
MVTSPSIGLPANDTSAPEESTKPKTFKVDERNSFELVIAFTGPVGSGVSTACHEFIRQLREDFSYEPHYLKVSDIIKEHASEVGEDLSADLNPIQRVDQYQNAGNKLRARRPSYLADRAIEQINAIRRQEKGVLEQENTPDIPLQKRLAYVVDSLKNPEEVKRFRQIYGDLFWHVTVFAPDEVREKRLVANSFEATAVRHIMKRDEQEGDDTGQQVSKTAHLADYFIRNHTDLLDSIKPGVRRFLDTIFGTRLSTPTRDETGMMKAASAAVRSACMSRQVGAAIYSAQQELIGVGCNDVPKAGGGLYSSDLQGDEDKRCYRWGGKQCHNDAHKQDLAKKIARSVLEIQPNGIQLSDVYTKVASSNSKNLIEFSRSVHAEMEAIVSVARSGKGSTVGSTLYTTTFPCHSCARHILAAGVARVVFIEPYSKSLALELHNDAITVTDEPLKVQFVQYEGFAPRSSLRVFSSVGRERKSDTGKFVEVSRRDASPLFPHPLDSYMSSEELVIQELANLQEHVNGQA